MCDMDTRPIIYCITIHWLLNFESNGKGKVAQLEYYLNIINLCGTGGYFQPQTVAMKNS